MSEEEQFAFWSSSNYKLSEQLVRIEARQQQTHDALLAAMDSLTSRTNHMHDDLRQRISSTLQPASSQVAVSGFPTAQLDVGLLCWIHRLTVNDGRVPALISGQLRTQNVWVGSLDENSPSYSPPPPQEVPTLVASWASLWRDGYRDTQRATRDDKIFSLTRFYYEILRIHPFLDGNGRVADALLDQAARELLQRSVLQSLHIDRTDHQRALFAANSGNLTPLRIRITAALS
jgi:Fic family protein